LLGTTSRRSDLVFLKGKAPRHRHQDVFILNNLFNSCIYSFQEKFFGVILHMLVLSHHKNRRGA
jgi:hypothetical protein